MKLLGFNVANDEPTILKAFNELPVTFDPGH